MRGSLHITKDAIMEEWRERASGAALRDLKKFDRGHEGYNVSQLVEDLVRHYISVLLRSTNIPGTDTRAYACFDHPTLGRVHRRTATLGYEEVRLVYILKSKVLGALDIEVETLHEWLEKLKGTKLTVADILGKEA
jgi:hypothetical protein